MQPVAPLVLPHPNSLELAPGVPGVRGTVLCLAPVYFYCLLCSLIKGNDITGNSAGTYPALYLKDGKMSYISAQKNDDIGYVVEDNTISGVHRLLLLANAYAHARTSACAVAAARRQPLQPLACDVAPPLPSSG